MLHNISCSCQILVKPSWMVCHSRNHETLYLVVDTYYYRLACFNQKLKNVYNKGDDEDISLKWTIRLRSPLLRFRLFGFRSTVRSTFSTAPMYYLNQGKSCAKSSLVWFQLYLEAFTNFYLCMNKFQSESNKIIYTQRIYINAILQLLRIRKSIYFI